MSFFSVFKLLCQCVIWRPLPHPFLISQQYLLGWGGVLTPELSSLQDILPETTSVLAWKTLPCPGGR